MDLLKLAEKYENLAGKLHNFDWLNHNKAPFINFHNRLNFYYEWLDINSDILLKITNYTEPEFISAGAYGQVFKLDNGMILKIFQSNYGPEGDFYYYKEIQDRLYEINKNYDLKSDPMIYDIGEFKQIENENKIYYIILEPLLVSNKKYKDYEPSTADKNWVNNSFNKKAATVWDTIINFIIFILTSGAPANLPKNKSINLTIEIISKQFKSDLLIIERYFKIKKVNWLHQLISAIWQKMVYEEREDIHAYNIGFRENTQDFVIFDS